MGKAIHWPQVFRDEVLSEDTEAKRGAIRLGRLYFDNQYWVNGEAILIRVNHLIVRPAIVVDELKCCKIEDLTPQDYEALKSSLRNQEALMTFLAQNYNQPVNPQTEITVVYYKNLPIDPELLEEPVEEAHTGAVL